MFGNWADASLHRTLRSVLRAAFVRTDIANLKLYIIGKTKIKFKRLGTAHFKVEYFFQWLNYVFAHIGTYLGRKGVTTLIHH